MANDAVFRELAGVFNDLSRLVDNRRELRGAQKKFRQAVAEKLAGSGFRPGDVRDLDKLLASVFSRECIVTAHYVETAFEQSTHLSDLFEKLLRLEANPPSWATLWRMAHGYRGETGRAARAALRRGDSARAAFLMQCC